MGFYEVFGEVGATVVSIVFSLFVGYLLYIRERRDKIAVEKEELEKEMELKVNLLRGTIIPGIDLEGKLPTRGERLDITKWVAGPPWEMYVGLEVEGMKKISNANEMWEEVFRGLKNLVNGVLPAGYLFRNRAKELEDRLGKVKQLLSFRWWGEKFLENSKHIEWFCHEYHGSSWSKRLIMKMAEFEAKEPFPVLTSREMARVLNTIMELRRLTREGLHLDRNYENLEIRNAVTHFKVIIGGFLFMGFFSIAIPLLMLLLPSFNFDYLVASVSFLCFIISTLITAWLLLHSATK